MSLHHFVNDLHLFQSVNEVEREPHSIYGRLVQKT